MNTEAAVYLQIVPPVECARYSVSRGKSIVRTAGLHRMTATDDLSRTIVRRRWPSLHHWPSLVSKTTKETFQCLNGNKGRCIRIATEIPFKHKSLAITFLVYWYIGAPLTPWVPTSPRIVRLLHLHSRTTLWSDYFSSLFFLFSPWYVDMITLVDLLFPPFIPYLICRFIVVSWYIQFCLTGPQCRGAPNQTGVIVKLSLVFKSLENSMIMLLISIVEDLYQKWRQVKWIVLPATWTTITEWCWYAEERCRDFHICCNRLHSFNTPRIQTWIPTVKTLRHNFGQTHLASPKFYKEERRADRHRLHSAFAALVVWMEDIRNKSGKRF
jgi:hypothetical protein